jgi:hypothetical protein
VIDELLHDLNMKLCAEYGQTKMVHAIVLDREAFDKVAYEFMSPNGRFRYSARPSTLNDLVIDGVRILCRERSTI